MKTVLGIVGIIVGIAIVVVGVFFDISWFLVGGIEEAIHGSQANPVVVHEIVEGVVRFFLTGVVTVAAILVGSLVGTLIAKARA